MWAACLYHQVMATRCHRLRAAGNAGRLLACPSRLSCRPSGGSPLAPACLLDVCRRMPRRYRPITARALLRAVPACLGSLPLLCFAPSSMSVPVLLPSHCFSPPSPLPSTRWAGRYDEAVAVLSALLACPSAHHLIRAVRHRMATGSGACLVRLPIPARRLCRLLPALAQSDFLAVLSSCRPIISHRLPSPITRHEERGGFVFALPVCLVILFRFVMVPGCRRLPLRCRRRLAPCLLAPAVPFMSAHRGIAVASPVVFSPVPRPACLLASSPHAHQSRGIGAGRLCGCFSPIGSVACPLGRLVSSFAPPYRHGERGGRRGVACLRDRSRSRRGGGDG